MRQGNDATTHQALLGGGERQLHGGGPQEAGGWALEAVGEQSQDLGGIPHKSAVEIVHAQEPLQLLVVGGGRKVVDGLQVLGQRSDASAGH